MFYLIPIAVMLILVGWVVYRVARRSGVTGADLSRHLPGDNLIEDPQMVMDRAAIFQAPAEAVWPWLVQLGKDRGGWYVPAWLERFTGRTMLSGLHQIEDQFQHIATGDFVPDYGPGEPLFKVILLEPDHCLVYLSIRQPSANWTWPQPDNPLPTNALALSWTLLLEETTPGQSRLYIRLRGKSQGQHASLGLFLIGGWIDYLTIVLMFAGLKQRIRETATPRL